MTSLMYVRDQPHLTTVHISVLSNILIKIRKLVLNKQNKDHFDIKILEQNEILKVGYSFEKLHFTIPRYSKSFSMSGCGYDSSSRHKTGCDLPKTSLRCLLSHGNSHNTTVLIFLSLGVAMVLKFLLQMI